MTSSNKLYYIKFCPEKINLSAYIKAKELQNVNLLFWSTSSSVSNHGGRQTSKQIREIIQWKPVWRIELDCLLNFSFFYWNPRVEAFYILR